ncbi:Endonuclease [Nakaseomyces bracarensis]|uniref:Ribonuclease n=1 Tax=Nakaseomyces bracarensis TaxID=273131 RepID=A0ABR4NPS7_9SACH
MTIDTTLPPTVVESLGSLKTKTYFSSVPDQIKNSSSPIILGVDEAGRGPVMGPMVYGISYCTKDYQDNVLIPNYSFDDSKKLTDPVRRQLFKLIYEGEIGEVGYATTAITAFDISTGMSRYPPSRNYNLNEQAHDVTMALIQGVVDRGVKLEHVYVDTVGPPASYQKKLEQRFPTIKFTVAKKADSLYCVVSVASVVAKVTRDLLIESLKRSPEEVMGSGYPSDPKTVAWLKANQKPLQGWPIEMVRFSWQTCQTLLKDKSTGSISITWDEDYTNTKRKLVPPTIEDPDYLKNPITLDNWFIRD